MIYDFEGSFKSIYVDVYSIVSWKHELSCLSEIAASKYNYFQ